MNFQSSFKLKLIYVFRINDAAHKGCLKVGETTFKESGDPFSLQPNCSALNKAAKERINQYTATAGIAYDLLHTELTLSIKNGQLWSFNDGEVHKVLTRSGIQHKYFDTDKKANEWFVTDLETVKNAIKAAKEGRTSLHASEVSTGNNPIEFRPEQRAAIDQTIRKFKKANQFLWNAKMRFGKTLSALQVVKEMNLDRTLILTHRPVVDAGWYEDYKKIFYDRYDFEYGSKTKGEEFETLSELHDSGGKKFIYFASMQDLRGSELVGGNFDKNDEVFAMPWDLVIIDEAHEGTKTDLGEAVIRELAKEHTKILRLSGTPFNLLDDYKEDEIYTWDYVMEQRAKQEWDETHWGDPNPYACLPKLNIYTYDLSLELKKYQDEEHAFNFKEFFRTNEEGNFIHDADIDRFLDLLASNSETSQYPYSTLEWRRNFRHSLWTVPGVREARALKAKLEAHPTFSMFKVVNVAGDGVNDDDFENSEALAMVNEAIGKTPEDTWTITLSCGRLTTGVSVKEWTAVFMLSGSFSTSASSYMQTIFRVQTPATIAGKMKTECFVFDFAPDRTLKVLAETAKVSAKAGKTTESDEQRMGEFLNFCPVISFDGSKMSAVNVPHMMQQLKRVYVERVVKNGFEDGYLYNDSLFKLTGEELEAFEGLKKIIGQTKAMPKSNDVDINNQGFTNEEYEELDTIKKKKKKELTEEEKKRLEELSEKKKNRDAAISILRGISIRMPMILYGATITNEEEEISIDNFTSLVDDLSWEEFMPKGVTKEKFDEFKKYYDKDIFAAAGKRIRALARAADNMDIEERIERITSIFTTFRNPDKETVLTPWRVVNMHLGDTLGGYVFYDETFDEKQRLSSPRFVDNGEVTSEVFSPDSRILEINSKSGLYPLYVAYNIYRRKLQSESQIIPIGEDAAERRLAANIHIWDEVLRDNLFIICKTPMAKSITRRTLAGFREGVKVNTHAFDDLINQITNKKDSFIEKVTRGSFWGLNNIKNMKFNAVVGNPPYQKENEGDGTGSNPIYHLFIDIAAQLGSISTLIHPARFLFNAGKTPKDWNKKILNDIHFRVIDYFVNSKDVFSTVDIKGGVAMTLYDNKHEFKKIGIYSSHQELSDIVERVTSQDNFKSFAELVYPRDLYKLTDKLYEENPWAEGRQSVGHKYDVGSGIFSVFPELLYDEAPLDGQRYARLYGRLGADRVTKWIKCDYLKVPDNFNFYKVFIPKTNGSGAIGEVLSTPVVGLPVVGHTVTFLSIGKFKTFNEAEAALKYVKTKFARTLLGSLKVTQDNPRETWSNVPLQDFTPPERHRLDKVRHRHRPSALCQVWIRAR